MANNFIPWHPIASMYYGREWPDELQEAVAQAVFVEMEWRLAPYEGRLARYDMEYGLAQQAKIALSRYADILASWWWACYVDHISYQVVFDLRRTLDDITHDYRHHYQQINGAI